MLLGRSVLAEVGRNFLMSLTATTALAFFILSISFLKRTPGIGMEFLLQVFPLFFPLTLQFTVPLAALSATILTFARMETDNETLALKAAGVHLRVLVLPVLAAAALLAVASLHLGDALAPYAAERLRNAHRDLFQQLHTSLRSGMRQLDLGQARLSFESFSGDRFDDLVLEYEHARRLKLGDRAQPRAELGAPGEPRIPVLVRARRGRFSVTPDDYVVAELELLAALPPTGSDDSKQYVSAAQISYEVPVNDLVGEARLKRRRNGLRAWELAHASARGVTRAWGRSLSAASALEELARRTALAAAVFFLAWAGIPLGILSGKGGRMTNFMTASAPVMLVYFPLVIAGSSLARSGKVPAYAALWAGNAVLAVGAAWLLRRVFRR